MVIKLYGTRGSLPVATRETVKYGGNTTCLYVESKAGDAIVVDAGSGIRELGGYLVKKKKTDIHLLFTHYHWDHLQGLPFFAPIFFKNTQLTIYGPIHETTPKEALFHQMMRPYFPTITWGDIMAKVVYKDIKKKIKIGNITIQTIANNHPNYTLGLKFIEGKKSFAFLTDNELFCQKATTPFKKFVEFVKGCDFFIHDAAYTDELYPTRLGWGHSTFNQVMQLAGESGVKKIIFTHHDPPSTDKFVDGIVAQMKKTYPKYSITAAADGMTFILK